MNSNEIPSIKDVPKVLGYNLLKSRDKKRDSSSFLVRTRLLILEQILDKILPLKNE